MKNIFPCEYEDYLILDRCGSGGMAEVFRAITRDPVSRLVVIKKSHAMIQQDPQVRNMFLDEIKVSARMNHPNIVHLNSYGSGGEYIELEYVYGKTINDVWADMNEKNQSIPISVALFVAHEVAKGLSYAHSMVDKLTGDSLNIIHRDISPHNIMLSYNSEVKILDFGIAKVATNMAHTQNGVLKGKPFYMSPEQAQASGKIDCRTDVFSLGVVLWNMVSNQKLFDAKSSAEYLEKLTAFEVQDPRDFNPDCSENLSKIIIKALQQNPGDRFPDMETFRKEIYQESTQLCEGHSVVPVVKSWVESQFAQEIEREKDKLQNLLSQAKIYMNNVSDDDTDFVLSESAPVSAIPSSEKSSKGGSLNFLAPMKNAAVVMVGLVLLIQAAWFGSQWYGNSSIKQMKKAQALVEQNNWPEALQTLKTVDPEKRNEPWQKLLVKTTVALLKQKGHGDIKGNFIKNFDKNIYSFNQLKENSLFIAARSHLAEKAFESCLRSQSLNCIEHLSKIWNRAPLDSESLYKMADRVTYFYLPRFAMPIYARAHQDENTKPKCNSKRQALSVDNLLRSLNQMSKELQAAFEVVALGDCASTYLPKIEGQISKMADAETLPLCRMLRQSRSPSQVKSLCEGLSND